MQFYKIFISCLAVYLTTLKKKSMVDGQGYNPKDNALLQKFTMDKLVDPVPPLESIKDCNCPRIYLPVCSTNNQSFTSICKMNCMNTKRELWDTNYTLTVLHVGLCFSHFDPFDY